ncbi:MAG TPA: antibiotic biosynthesis monooxygenase [Bacteroidales bacterium]|nr:antibiotic biosynthesis monooxygenase [Bacteroidales bacterium]
MIVICVYVHVKSDAVNSFINATVTNHLESVKEPGNLRFDFIQQSDDPCRFMIYEAYESEEAAASHKNTDHYLKWRDTVKDFMVEPRQGIKYNILVPNDRAKW